MEMQITLICLLSVVSAIFAIRNDGCTKCELRNSPNLCGSNCLKLGDDLENKDTDLPSKGGRKRSTLGSTHRFVDNSGDRLCLNFQSKGKFNRLDRGIEGFIVNKGKLISLKDLLELAHSNQRFKRIFNNELDSYQESSDNLKEPFEDIDGIVLGRGGWGDLRPPWG